MKFFELDQNSQDFLIDQLNTRIEEYAQEEGIYDYEELSFDEYVEFFDEFDEDYEMVDGFPKSALLDEYRKQYSIHFEDKRVILEVYEVDPYDDSDDEQYYDFEDNEY